MTDTRAQSPLDFAIAMGIFLVAVTFVFTFIPSLTAPFVEGDQDRSAAANRVASHLAEGALGDPADPFVVNETCATVFFDASTDDSNIPSGCGYSGDDVDERVGVNGDRLRVNVTVEQVNATASGDARFRTVCHDDTHGVVHEDEANGSTSCDVRYTIGDEPSDRSSIVVARRVVTIPGCSFGVESCDAIMKVRVW
ncbi:hypothetical protein BRD02_02535 [Halobacteriales archaeon QS_8_69_73]|nr:MAG: hypothetical protein BRD02_02535 [Halobacteriales archaeon QS_8_69_73]